MNKNFIRVLSVIMAILLCSLSFCGCSSKGKTLMELDGTEISVNMFQLFLSRMKGNLASAYAYGEQALSDSFWDTVMSATGQTYNDHYTEQVLNNTKTYLAALYLFEQKGLKLPDSYIEEIDKELEDLLAQDADGSKNTFNSILADYGVNYNMLREAYIIEAKIAYLNDYLFGTNGSKISPTILEEYYKSNYVRFKHIFMFNYDLVWETDSDGNDIYYSVNDNKRISYDKTANIKKNEAGETVKDKNGDTVYIDTEGKIAYDKKNGQRNPVLDENGYQKTEKYSKEELIALEDRAQLIFEECKEGNYTLFDSLVESYNEDEGMGQYPNGYYLTADSDYDAPKVRDELFEMKNGEIRKIYSDYGIHIVMKYELDDAAYANTANKDFFINKDNGSYVFMSVLKNNLLNEYLEQYVEMIKIDESLLDKVDIKNIGANFHY